MPKYSKKDLLLAIVKVKEGNSISEAAKLFNIPKSTLTDNVKGSYYDFKKRRLINAVIEKELANYIIICHKKNTLPVTLNGVRKMVYELAVRKKLPHCFNDTLKIAGKIWMKNFMKNYKNISEIMSQSFYNNISKCRSNNRGLLYYIY